MSEIVNRHEIKMQVSPPRDFLFPFLSAVLKSKGIGCPVEVTLKVVGELDTIIIVK